MGLSSSEGSVLRRVRVVEPERLGRGIPDTEIGGLERSDGFSGAALVCLNRAPTPIGLVSD